MIRAFLSKRRLVFFPKSWANSVTSWICGVHSPSGTVKIVNTANPSKGKSASFDVDVDVVWERLRDRIDSLRREDDGQSLRDSRDETIGEKIQNGSTEDLDELKADVSELKSDVSGLTSDVTSLTSSVSDLVDSTQGIAADVDAILADYATGSEVDALGREVDALGREVYSLGSEVDALGSEVDALGREVYSLGEEVDLVVDSVADLAEIVYHIRGDYLSEEEADGKYAIRDDLGEDFVTTDTDQTITGAKTFNKTVSINTLGNAEYFQIEDNSNRRRGMFGRGDAWLDGDSGTIGIIFRNYNRNNKARIYYDYTDGKLKLIGYNSNGTSQSNSVLLEVAPSDTESTTERAIATLGWVNDKFIRRPTDKTLYTGTKDRITEIAWTGTVLRYRVTRETYYKGLLENSTSDQGWSTIDTPNLIVWS